nr:hypothetical protein [Sphingomonas sp. Y57]
MSALLILVVALSHGSMGAAAPHFGEHDYIAIASHHDDHAVDAHDYDAASASADEQGGQKSSPAAGHHSHLSFDVAPTEVASIAPRPFVRQRNLPLDDAWHGSGIVAPLAEPPSA